VIHAGKKSVKEGTSNVVKEKNGAPRQSFPSAAGSPKKGWSSFENQSVAWRRREEVELATETGKKRGKEAGGQADGLQKKLLSFC